jgi:hypothetical protein
MKESDQGQVASDQQRFVNCKYGTAVCTCCHAKDFGACPTYERGANGMCVYCDHHEKCHTLADGKSFNTPT